MSCNDESSHNQATLADLELSEAGNTSSSRDVSSYDAATFENETLTCPIEIDEESANMSIEIAGTEEMTGGSYRSNDDKLICEQSGNAEISSTNEVLATSAECSSVDVAAVKDMNGISTKGFYFLIRMPRFDDEKIRERIKVAELNVDEKTQHRDAFRQKIRNKRVCFLDSIFLNLFIVDFFIKLSRNIILMSRPIAKPMVLNLKLPKL